MILNSWGQKSRLVTRKFHRTFLLPFQAQKRYFQLIRSLFYPRITTDFRQPCCLSVTSNIHKMLISNLNLKVKWFCTLQNPSVHRFYQSDPKFQSSSIYDGSHMGVQLSSFDLGHSVPGGLKYCNMNFSRTSGSRKYLGQLRNILSSNLSCKEVVHIWLHVTCLFG